MHPKIFISYNPGVDIEESTALRLQTLSSLYGAVVHLPDRLGAFGDLKDETKRRILDAQVFVMFSTVTHTEVVRDEVTFAFQNGKRVIIFYDQSTGPILDSTAYPDIVQIGFRPEEDNAAQLLQEVIDQGGFVRVTPPAQPNPHQGQAASSHRPGPVSQTSSPTKKDDSAVGALVGIGLGLFLLWALTKKDDG